MTYLDRMAQAPKHQPEYHIDERWDELYTYCAACGQEWPCEFAAPNDARGRADTNQTPATGAQPNKEGRT